MTSTSSATDRVSPSGLGFAISAYVLWGAMPIVFFSLKESGAIEIVAWRIVLSLVFCAALLVVTRGYARVMAIVRDRRTFWMLGLGGAFVVVNWLIYVYASLNGHIVEAALGYFTNPIVTVLLGVLVLRERLRPLQWVALAISALAVLVLAIGYGSFPWIALGLAFSFGLYGLVKKSVGPKADAVGGLAVETAFLTPVAIVVLLVLAANGQLAAGTAGPGHLTLTLFLGAITAIPLILFAAAARRLPLTYMGLAQYLAPILQLIVGVFVFHEAMPPERWLGFAIVWVALAILTYDLFRHSSRTRLGSAAEAPGAP
ncbi:EamA family transporter RarD [Salinibacterium sp. NSLL150]|uniref:EamA family transporter RarD n=1 Tax=unclassified Salinibacterium TaxID=2632331 RepID=UPI0018CF81CA|nr:MULTISPECIES: EamA family transporter RarD [unclassified Salinibacterium]MBH0098286.1 EamA family transporter RarD [Salinibacterium sp. NSLL35]MBH0101041.1 EamA family transporter RarD [Salinibacterium sp. NSLL150]MBH0103800.1 EamA family transporter RarD [Salinibacterium sp. NSLL16]MBH0106561.1 EamA family transporter RarD [Salinibacterium sp. NSLL17]